MLHSSFYCQTLTIILSLKFFFVADRLTPRLIVDEEGPRLKITFPTVIPGEFDIVAYYNYKEHHSRRFISHPAFRNTKEVNIAIPLDKLPRFRTFSVRVALSVANKTGGESVSSNQISKWLITSWTHDCIDFKIPSPLLTLTVSIYTSRSTLACYGRSAILCSSIWIVTQEVSGGQPDLKNSILVSRVSRGAG